MKGVYIHIPFCKTICFYCDFCKMYYNEKWAYDYLKALKEEVNKFYQNDKITSIYIGGGTPSSLNDEQLTNLLELTKIFKHDKIEFTFECNIDITENQLKILKDYGVNRISVGIQTINDKFIAFLNRGHNQDMVLNKIKLINKYFDNINVDLIYALPNETLDDLKKDLNFLTSLPISHISTYSLMIEPNTMLYIKGVEAIDEEMDYQMYDFIKTYLKEKGFNHYETSNFCLNDMESKHNLTYWNNEQYYGFGLGASGYLDNIRYENTKNLNKYLKGEYRLDEHILSKAEQIENTFILGLRKVKGVDKNKFMEQYGNIKIPIIDKLIEKGKLIDDGKNIYIPSDKEYIANTILVDIIGEIDEV